jgi:hypothetical protein
MADLILALQIFQKYADKFNPIHCKHDVLMVVGIEVDRVAIVDQFTLSALGFFWSSEYDCFVSYRFGSGTRGLG